MLSFIYEFNISVNPGLAITGFRTTGTQEFKAKLPGKEPTFSEAYSLKMLTIQHLGFAFDKC